MDYTVNEVLTEMSLGIKTGALTGCEAWFDNRLKWQEISSYIVEYM